MERRGCGVNAGVEAEFARFKETAERIAIPFTYLSAEAALLHTDGPSSTCVPPTQLFDLCIHAPRALSTRSSYGAAAVAASLHRCGSVLIAKVAESGADNVHMSTEPDVYG